MNGYSLPLPTGDASAGLKGDAHPLHSRVPYSSYNRSIHEVAARLQRSVKETRSYHIPRILVQKKLQITAKPQPILLLSQRGIVCGSAALCNHG
jgi:hypothetical protein